MRKDHELDRYLLEKKKREFLAKKRKRGSADDPICHQFGDFVVVIGETRPGRRSRKASCRAAVWRCCAPRPFSTGSTLRTTTKRPASISSARRWLGRPD